MLAALLFMQPVLLQTAAESYGDHACFITGRSVWACPAGNHDPQTFNVVEASKTDVAIPCTMTGL